MTWCVSTPSVEKKTEVGEASTLITNRNRPSNAWRGTDVLEGKNRLRGVSLACVELCMRFRGCVISLELENVVVYFILRII